MDGENHGSNPMNKWDDLGVRVPLFLVQHPCHVWFTRWHLNDRDYRRRFEFPHPWSSFFLCYPWSKLEKQHTDDTQRILGGFCSKVDLLAVCLDVSYLRLFSVWLSLAGSQFRQRSHNVESFLEPSWEKRFHSHSWEGRKCLVGSTTADFLRETTHDT